MKKQRKNTIFLLIFIFLTFCANYYEQNKIITSKILKVNQADEFYVDLNNNNKIEENELAKLANIEAFKPIKTPKAIEISKKLSIDIEDYLKNGILAKNWAIENLENNSFQIKIVQNPTDIRNYYLINLNYKNEPLEDFYLRNGLAYLKSEKSPKEENIQQIKNNAKELSKLDFIILNLKSSIYHSLDCEYAKLAKNIELYINKQFNKENYFPCKNCQEDLKIKTLQQTFNIPKSKYSYRKEVYKKFENIEMFFINPTEYKNPNTTCTTKLCKRIVEEIDNSKNSIDLALYGVGNQKEIINALYRAKARNVTIRFVFDKSKSSEEIYPFTKELSQNFNSTYDDVNSLMHNKFIIFDNSKIMTGSTNISSSGTGGYNANISTIINSKELAEIYQKEFNQMFLNKFSKNKKSIESNAIKSNDTELKAYFTPKTNVLNEAILPLIQNAKSEILLSAFYLTDKKLISELSKAKSRGVNVIILIDSLCSKNFNERLALLKNQNIPIKTENWGGKNHEKTMLIDKEVLLIGSCNFSASGFNKNDENILIIKNKEIANTYRDYFLYLFNSLDDRLYKIIPRAESLDSGNSCFDGIDNNFDGKIDSQDEGCKIKK